MSEVKMKMMDGNEAAASVAHRMNEVCVIYPITPSSPMNGLMRGLPPNRKTCGASFPKFRKCSLKQVLPALATVLFRPVP